VKRCLLILAALLVNGVSYAGASDYVFEPAAEYREREIDFKYGAASAADAADEHAASVGFGYGARPWWFTEFYAKYKREEGRTFFDAFEWENKFTLTEAGRYPVDLGWIVELERPRDRAEGYELNTGPLLQKDFGRLQINTNLLITTVFDSADSNGTTLGYQWQARYRWHQQFEFGAQGFGEMGEWNHWLPRTEQSHRWGPAVYGKLPIEGRRAIRYNAALLFGLTNGSPDRNFRMQLEYEF
jgi:hypothetical protein